MIHVLMRTRHYSFTSAIRLSVHVKDPCLLLGWFLGEPGLVGSLPGCLPSLVPKGNLLALVAEVSVDRMSFLLANEQRQGRTE